MPKQEIFMENGYKIFWTSHALFELEQTYQYLENNFSEKELITLSKEIERVIALITKNPKLFPSSSKQSEVRKVVIETYNSMYYRINNDNIEILSFFSNRQNPNNVKI